MTNLILLSLFKFLLVPNNESHYFCSSCDYNFKKDNNFRFSPYFIEASTLDVNNIICPTCHKEDIPSTDILCTKYNINLKSKKNFYMSFIPDLTDCGKYFCNECSPDCNKDYLTKLQKVEDPSSSPPKQESSITIQSKIHFIPDDDSDYDQPLNPSNS